MKPSRVAPRALAGCIKSLSGGSKLGVHLYRSDRFAAEERQLAPGADVNLGVRLF